MTKNSWSFNATDKEPFVRRLLAHVSIKIRYLQYLYFKNYLRPNTKTKVLDVGITPNEELVDSNFFERQYPYQSNLTSASIEDCSSLKSKYPEIKFKKIKSSSKLPYKDEEFDAVVSWATIEHVGNLGQQKLFLRECLRVGKKTFITTPNKGFFYELHTNMLFVHWLPHKYFKLICDLSDKKFWGKTRNLNLLSARDLEKIMPKEPGIEIIKFRLLGLFTSHFLIIKA